jgi:hypothetical protein
MKLNATQVKQTLTQMNARVLPEDHPAVGQLIELFGDHTFFLDENGLKVLEVVEPAKEDTQAGKVVSLADWSDSTASSLRAHKPVVTGVVVVLN